MGLIVGVFWFFFVVIFKVYWGVYEVILIIMFNWIVFYFVSWLVVSVYYNLRDLNSIFLIFLSVRFLFLMEGMSFFFVFIIVVFIVIIVYVIMWYMKLGYEFRVSG